MNEVLSRRYGRWLRAYPRSYRAAHGAEVLDTLVEAAGPARAHPEAREVASLLVGGLRERVRQAPNWRLDGVHLGLTAYFAFELGRVLHYGGWIAAAIALGSLLALMRGRLQWAIPPYLVAAALSAHEPSAGFMGSLWFDRLPTYLLPVLMLGLFGLFSVRRSRVLRPRSGLWLAVPVLLELGPPSYVVVAGLFALLVAGLGLSALARDPRWVLATLVFALPNLMMLGAPTPGRGTLLGLAAEAVVIVAVLSIRRRRPVRN
jgi:hypothetical protein